MHDSIAAKLARSLRTLLTNEHHSAVLSNDELHDAREALAEYDTAKESTAAEQWRPISTAPKDERVLVWNGHERFVAHWARHEQRGDEAWIVAEWGNEGDQILCHPTHWQPLPQPPTSAPEAQEK